MNEMLKGSLDAIALAIDQDNASTGKGGSPASGTQREQGAAGIIHVLARDLAGYKTRIAALDGHPEITTLDVLTLLARSIREQDFPPG